MQKNEKPASGLDPLFAKHSDELQQEGRARIAALVAHADPVELFVTALSVRMFAPPSELTEANFGSTSVKSELLAYELFPHFPDSSHSLRATVSGSVEGQQNVESDGEAESMLLPDDVLDCLDAVDKILIGRSFRGAGVASDSVVRITQSNAEVVRGNGYPFQTERRIREVQGRFDRWFVGRVGLSPSRAVELVMSIARVQEDVFNDKMHPEIQKVAVDAFQEWKIAKSTPKRQRTELQQHLSEVESRVQMRSLGVLLGYTATAPLFLPVRREEVNASKVEWAALLRLIGFSKTERLAIDDPVKIRHRPLYVLPDERALVVDVSNVFDALWDAFDDLARADQGFYNRDYQRHAAKWLEGRALAHLSRIFPTDSVYQTLDYEDPDATAGSRAELDAAVVWGPFLILVEAKAKQFRMAGQLGDVARLRTDIQQNVEEAFRQARRARKYIESVERPVFKERKTGRVLSVVKSDVRRVYLLTLSMHHLATVTTQLGSLGPLGLFRDNEYPFAISEADLEIIAELCPGPDVFLHYIEKRNVMHGMKTMVSADELDLFGAYLDTRFSSGQLWDDQSSGISGFVLGGYTDAFDQWALHRWRGLGEVPEIRLRVPDEIRAVLEQLRQGGTSDARWIAFCILNLERDALDLLAEGFRSIRVDPPALGRFRRFVVSGKAIVLCVVAANGVHQAELRANLERRVLVEKYRRKASLAFGFGVAAEDPSKSFSIAIRKDGEWRSDPGVERLVEEDPPAAPLSSTAVPGRNDPCFCGSGQKFKRCCIAKVAKARRMFLR